MVFIFAQLAPFPYYFIVLFQIIVKLFFHMFLLDVVKMSKIHDLQFFIVRCFRLYAIAITKHWMHSFMPFVMYVLMISLNSTLFFASIIKFNA